MTGFIQQLDPSSIIQIVMFFLAMVVVLLGPKFLMWQIMAKMENDLAELEHMTERNVRLVSSRMKKKTNHELDKKLRGFLEFIAVPPVDLDPRGIVAKLDKVVREQRDAFHYFVVENTDIKDASQRQNIEAAIGATIGTHQITKVVRHFLELIKKYKNLQIAMIVQIQMPMIKELATAFSKAAVTFADGDPVGDSVGPYVAAQIIGDTRPKKLKNTATVYAVKQINGRRCIVVKADGPGADVGYPGEAMRDLIRRYKPVRIVTIDAFGKLEGEETGSIAEGVGVGMGGVGTERYEIEEVATRMRIPIDVVAIKMKSEEAFGPMPLAVLKAVPEAIGAVERKLERVPRGRTCIILGVGNTSGVGNNRKSLRDADERIHKNVRKMKAEEAQKEKKRSWLASLFSD